MKGYCRCCGKYRETKEHKELLFCASCVRKINAGKESSFEDIKKLHERFDFVFGKEG